MFGIGKRASGNAVAVADIASGSAGIAIIGIGSMQLLSVAREDLTLEDRSADALSKGVLQALAVAGDKILKELNASGNKIRVGHIYCIVGAPWTRSVAGEAFSHLEKETIVTDDMIGNLAKQALADQKDIERANLLEANVVRVLLNGYPTTTPAGKRAEEVRIFTLLSDCKLDLKNQVQETLAHLFPDAPITWRSSARAILRAANIHDSENSLVALVGAEATDLMVVRKGILTERALIPQGVRQIATSFGAGKPSEETLSLLEMLENEQCETDACKALEQSIAKAEPELAHSFGETFAKLSAFRKLPDEMILIAPAQLSPWLSRFFARIDFTQFTASTRPFAVSPISSKGLPGALPRDPRVFADPGLSIGYALVNMEMGQQR